MSSKATNPNPKDLAAVNKLPLAWVPPRVLTEIGLALGEGGTKYGPYNYRQDGCLASVYYSATLRHLFAWFEGQDLDPDSGLSHVTKAIASLTVLRDSMMAENWVDDRPQGGSPECIQDANELFRGIRDRYLDKSKTDKESKYYSFALKDSEGVVVSRKSYHKSMIENHKPTGDTWHDAYWFLTPDVGGSEYCVELSFLEKEIKQALRDTPDGPLADILSDVFDTAFDNGEVVCVSVEEISLSGLTEF